MNPLSADMRELDRQSYRIVGMICSEAVPEPEVEAAISGLRERTGAVFPEDPSLYDRIYGRRFARLRTRFRPAPALFSTSRAAAVD